MNTKMTLAKALGPFAVQHSPIFTTLVTAGNTL